MKRFVLMSYGFETPTPEIMAVWKAWFASIKSNIVDIVGLGAGREISKAGRKELPLGPESITGLVIVNADSLDEAERMAQGNPFMTSIRVYEVRAH